MTMSEAHAPEAVVTAAAHHLAAETEANRAMITVYVARCMERLETLERQAADARRELGVVLALIEQAA
jgi:hypothetical protein